MKKAFTLAEMMIVLVVIAVITAILLPAARHATPDENILKFKKAHNTLYTTIRELVNSDKYYLDGDLGTHVNGDDVEKSNYFCETFSDIISTKSKNCEEFETPNVNQNNTGLLALLNNADDIKKAIDDRCAQLTKDQIKSYIVSQDGIAYIEVNPEYPFGKKVYDDGGCTLKAKNNYYDIWDGIGLATEENKCLHFTSGFYFVYKPFCVDIDGIGEGEAPFGYGIRIDGKILSGARAEEWLEKSINRKD